MVKTIKIIKENEQHLTDHLDDYIKVDVVFRKIRKDYVGQSSSNPTWGYVFNVRNGKLKLNIDPDGLYKEYDYDTPNASYAEKISSIMGRSVLDNTRVPKVDVVIEKPKEPSIISYKLMNNDKEDMFHIRDLMFYKFDRDQLSEKKNIFTIEDILECVKQQIGDEENYKEVERSMLHTLLLDAVMNNADRHNNNWALVRDKETGKYELAIYDHSSSLVDMLEDQRNCTHEGWVGSYITLDDNAKLRKGSLGKDLIKHISKNYPEYYDEFVDRFNEKLPDILKEIKEENLPINTSRLEMKLKQRSSFLNKMKDREELEYGE